MTPSSTSERARCFGAVADGYDSARSRYATEMYDHVLGGAGPSVLDLGCGTGIVGREVRRRGHDVVGVEPDERMATVAQASGLAVEVAAFEDWERAGRSFDVTMCGDAWHWFDPSDRVELLADTLRPGGRVAVFWNIRWLPPDLTSALVQLYRDATPELADSVAAPAPTGVRDADLDEISTICAPGVCRRRFSFVRTFDGEGLAADLATMSRHVLLDPTTAAKLREDVLDRVRCAPAPVVARYETTGIFGVRR